MCERIRFLETLNSSLSLAHPTIRASSFCPVIRIAYGISFFLPSPRSGARACVRACERACARSTSAACLAPIASKSSHGGSCSGSVRACTRGQTELSAPYVAQELFQSSAIFFLFFFVSAKKCGLQVKRRGALVITKAAAQQQ